MKIKKIAALCKAAKQIYIYEKGDMQYIGTGAAIYPLYGMPRINEENAFTIFDIPVDKRDDYCCKICPAPEFVSLDDGADFENVADKPKLDIVFRGSCIPLETSQGIIFIKEAYLAPVEDESETLELYERINEAGQTFIVAKAGFMLLAVIMPYSLLDEKFCKELMEFAKNCRATWEKSEEIAAARRAQFEGDQMGLEGVGG